MSVKEVIGVITGVIVLFGALFGAYQYLECRYAPIVLADEVKKVDQKADKTLQIMEYKFKAIQLETIENRIYRVKEEAGKNPSKADKERLNELEQDKKKVLQEMEEIKEKK